MRVKEFCKDIVFIASCLLILSMFIVGIRRWINHYEFKLVARESQRYAAHESTGILIVPHQWNQIIEANQASRKTWWGKLIVQKKWEDVEPIH